MVKVIISDSFKNDVLDEYLEKGWFRMYDHMFTTGTIEDDGKVHKVFWFRYHASQVTFGRKQRELCRKNRNFTISYQPLIITEELEHLFTLYKNSRPFIGYSSLDSAFSSGFRIFNTWVVKVRDENKLLIAAGIYDRGAGSIAGIMNIYRPGFEKFSLGRFLILAKINYCRKFGIEWYYPGYIMRHPSKFDYKLFPDKESSEVFVEEAGVWAPYNTWKNEIEKPHSYLMKIKAGGDENCY